MKKLTLLVTLATGSLLSACGSEILDLRPDGDSSSGSTSAGGDACEAITCGAPPAATCVSDSTLRTHDATGACAAGVCSYGYVDTLCPSGCSEGTCSEAVTPMVSTGLVHACAVTSAGAVKCWGSNTAGRLGDDSTIDSLVPVDVVGLSSGVRAVAVGSSNTCAITSTGAVKCWGRGTNGELGNGFTSDGYAPVDVVGLSSGVLAVSAGSAHTCAVTKAGAVKCWGWNADGQLGDDSTTDSNVPVDVAGLSSGVIAVAAGGNHTCAVTEAGAVKCWGYNHLGSLGDGSTTKRLTPVDVVGLSSGVLSIAAGSEHTCAVTKASGLVCWGWNDGGQLGNGTMITSLVPVGVVGLSSGVLAVSASTVHTCAVTKAGAVECWGLNFFGQLGDGGEADSPVPVGVVGLASGAVSISTGSGYTCAGTEADVASCWGPRFLKNPKEDNYYSTVPVKVMGL